jgi:hypothetical protein
MYTDDSGISGKNGAAAVAPNANIVRKAFMGRDTKSNVFAAELQGLLMALETVK